MPGFHPSRGTRRDRLINFSRHLAALSRSIKLNRWFIIAPAHQTTQDFVHSLKCAGREISAFEIADPKIKTYNHQNEMLKEIINCANDNPQLILCIVSNNGSTIKRCYAEFGLPTQLIVVEANTLRDKTKGASGLLLIATKVAIQINVILGGLPWLINMPESGLMTFGYGVCHDPKNRNSSWSALVATMDLKKCNKQIFTAVNHQKNGEELSNDLNVNMHEALKQFMDINHALPERILFFRGGGGNGHIECAHEVAAIKKALKYIYERKNLPEVPFMYMNVEARVNRRIFVDADPDPNVHHVMPEWYDFLVVGHSPMTPTGFKIVHSSFDRPINEVQMVTSSFVSLGRNWNVKVPVQLHLAQELLPA